jgi:hypothetical protein
MKRIVVQLVLRLLQNEQKQHCLEVCRELEEDPDFPLKVVTGDESWVYGYDPESKQQSLHWKSHSSLRPKKAQHVKSSITFMLICVFYIDRTVLRSSSHLVRQSIKSSIVKFKGGHEEKTSREVAQE